MASLVQQCLESLGTYSTGPASAEYLSKYTAEDGAYLIEMESVEALNEIYTIDYLMECDQVAAIMNAKRTGVPASEALESTYVMESIGEKLKAMVEKVKAFIKKIMEKLKAWFANVKRFFASLLMKPAKFVETYKKDILAADKVKGWGENVLVFKYNDSEIDSFCGKFKSSLTGIVDAERIKKEFVNAAATAKAKGSEARLTAATKEIRGEVQGLQKPKLERMKALARALGLDDSVIKEDSSASSDIADAVKDKLMGGSKDESAKVPASYLEGHIDNEIKIITNYSKLVSDIDAADKAVNNTLKSLLKNLDGVTEDKYGKAASDFAQAYADMAKDVQTATTSAMGAFRDVAKNRAGTAFALCKRCLSYANKHRNDKK